MKQLTDHKVNSVLLGAISDVGQAEWNALADSDVPFLRHEFLSALESSGCVSQASGWEPSHYVCRGLDGHVLAVAPQYIKHHSYGEYVFDWSWADAYQRHGLPYYPKLVSAIPFTPCQSSRLLSAEANQIGADLHASLRSDYLKQCMTACDSGRLSSWHVLFPNHTEPYPDLLKRIGVQYHWFNRDYASFGDFLDRLVSRKRKNIRKERARIAAAALRFEWCPGKSLSGEQLDVFYRLYQSTYEKRGQQAYLSPTFFQTLLQDMAETMLFLFVHDGERTVAGALFFQGEKTLYGRYWGCLEEYDALHFETCYYRGIEWCIQEGLARFDAGAQGEHKLIRGFEPVETCSYHHIAHPAFKAAISDFLQEESRHVEAYIEQAHAALPFKQEAQG
ncbi:MAG: GNAT family N-acetyltransferase [Oleiphilus sp.]|nr:MAG: GNAT family N-acetyltransferase [Oleiphilus sp.]